MFFEPGQLPRTDLGLEGTPWFLAPENLDSEFYPASDLWSAGVMAFQLLSGFMPFDDRRSRGSPALSQASCSCVKMGCCRACALLMSERTHSMCHMRVAVHADLEINPDRGARLQQQRLEGCLRQCKRSCPAPAEQVRATLLYLCCIRSSSSPRVHITTLYECTPKFWWYAGIPSKGPQPRRPLIMSGYLEGTQQSAQRASLCKRL